MKRIHALILFFLSLSFPETNAQPERFRFQYLSVDDGLSQDIVTSITQDDLGFMWFGTEDGLNAYDGFSFTVFKHTPGDSSTLNGNDVTSLLPDGRGGLWVGTATGLDVIDVRTRAVRHVYGPAGEPLPGVIALIRAGGADVWIATMKGLFRSSGMTATRMYIRGKPVTDQIWSLRAEGPDRLWCVGEKGASCCRVNQDTLVQVELPEVFRRSLRGLAVSTVLRDRRGRFWVCTGNAGIVRFDSTLRPAGRYTAGPSGPHSIHDNGIRTVLEDRTGSLWFGTMSGVEVIDPESGRITHLGARTTSPGGLLGSRTYALYTDRTGIIWIGTYRGGINSYAPDRQKFRLYPLTGESSPQEAYAILETSDGTILAGTERGVYSPGLGSGDRPWTRRRGYEGRTVYSLGLARNGDVWVGMEGAIGTLPGWSRRQRVISLPVRDPVRFIFEDEDAGLWIGTDLNGVFRVARGASVAVQWTHRGEKIEGGAWAMAEDRRGAFWIGTYTSRWLYRYDRVADSLARFGPRPGSDVEFSGTTVKAMREDSAGNLWLGTWGTGLYRLDHSTGSFTRYMESDGLASNFVKSIEIDRHGGVWIGTERGLTCFDPLHGTFRSFYTRDGLQGNFFYSGASVRGRDGILYFGGPGGVIGFDPDSIRYNRNPPPVAITGFKVFDRPVQFLSSFGGPETVTLRYDQVFFSFEFVALDFTDPPRNRYSYMLEGFDANWVDAGSRRYASYTQMDPGAYTFRVRASNSDAVWNEEGTALRIVIAPAFWATWWFRGAVAAVLVLAFLAFYRTRIRTILEVERLRQRIARDLHDDIGTNLSAIVLASEMSARLPSSSAGQAAFDEIRTIALVTQDHMRDIVWMLNPTNDSVGLLIARMRDDAARLLRAIPYTFLGPQGELPSRIELGLKRNIFLIYKEILHNIVKHSDATAVEIAISLSGTSLELSVRDNGRGFDPATVVHGNGIDSMAGRARQIHANLRIESRAGYGTQISLAANIT